mgnify:CR=1 FL=1
MSIIHDVQLSALKSGQLAMHVRTGAVLCHWPCCVLEGVQGTSAVLHLTASWQ